MHRIRLVTFHHVIVDLSRSRQAVVSPNAIYMIMTDDDNNSITIVFNSFCVDFVNPFGWKSDVVYSDIGGGEGKGRVKVTYPDCFYDYNRV